MQCLTVRELECGLGINPGIDCKKRECQVNSVLRRHYSRLIGSETTKGSIIFAGEGEHNLNTSNGESIYKVLGVYVRLTDCSSPSNCMRLVDNCKECDDVYSLRARESWADLDEGDYMVDCDKMRINVGQGVSEGYVMYSRGPREITDLDDEICLDPAEIEILQLGMQRRHHEIKKDIDMSRYFEQAEFNARKNLKENENKIPYSIGFGHVPN